LVQKRTINVNGDEVEVIDLDFKIRTEEWNEYDLADGGRIRVKLSVNRVMQVLDPEGKPARTPDGERFVVVQSTNQMVVQE
jgi:hypothetical protein